MLDIYSKYSPITLQLLRWLDVQHGIIVCQQFGLTRDHGVDPSLIYVFEIP